MFTDKQLQGTILIKKLQGSYHQYYEYIVYEYMSLYKPYGFYKP